MNTSTRSDRAGTAESRPDASRFAAAAADGLRTLAAGVLVGLGLLAFAPAAEASARQYVIKDSIHNHLRKTNDEFGLCQRHGMSMKPLVMFQPSGQPGQSLYWDRATDRFIRYPGYSGCSVWERASQG